MTLLEALQAGDGDGAAALLDAGADVNEIGSDGRTPLMIVAAEGDAAWVRRLLELGADPMLVDSMGETALLKAAAAGHRGAYEPLAALATREERDNAAAYLLASGKSHGPAGEPPSRLRTQLVGATARAAKFFGDDSPLARVERAKRAEKHRKG